MAKRKWATVYVNGVLRRDLRCTDVSTAINAVRVRGAYPQYESTYDLVPELMPVWDYLSNPAVPRLHRDWVLNEAGGASGVA